MRRFLGLELIEDALPDKTMILNFRHLLEVHQLTTQLMNTLNDELSARGLLFKCGTLGDAALIHAPSFNKNTEQARDPRMRQTKQANPGYFGMKAPVGADVYSGLLTRNKEE